MSRLSQVREKVDEIILNMEKKEKISSALAHLYGVSFAATFIAEHRGLNSELASIAGMMHDIYAYSSGSYTDHAHKGADMARNILNELNITSQQETDTICSMIYHHDDKEIIDGPMDEVLKDADVMHHALNDYSKEIKEKEKTRFEALKKEFDF